MIKFTKVPTLDDYDRKYLKEDVKPFLVQDKMKQAREHLLFGYEEADFTSVIRFLLYRLQDNYFNDCTQIFECEFFRMEELSSIDIPYWITVIGKSAFYGCEDLVDVKIPDGVVSIGSSAFCRCPGLKRVSVPKNCIIGEDAFDDSVEIIRR